MVFSCKRLWWLRRLGLHGDLRLAVLLVFGLIALIWKPLPDASVLRACACILSTKEETRTLRVLAHALRLPGARVVSIVMAHVTRAS